MDATRPSGSKYNPDTLLLVVDLVGTFVFAVEGGLAAVAGELDLLGLMVLSFVTALGAESSAICSSALFLLTRSETGATARSPSPEA